MRTTVKVSTRGQITLPASIRRSLGIKPHSRVEIIVEDDRVILRPVRSIADLHGIFRDRVGDAPPLGWEEERRAKPRCLGLRERRFPPPGES